MKLKQSITFLILAGLLSNCQGPYYGDYSTGRYQGNNQPTPPPSDTSSSSSADDSSAVALLGLIGFAAAAAMAGGGSSSSSSSSDDDFAREHESRVQSNREARSQGNPIPFKSEGF